jgi:hypothetical protein
MKRTILKRRITEAGTYRLKFAGVATAADFGSKRPPLLWCWDGGDLGLLEIISGTRPTEGSVCGQLFWLTTGGQPGQDADTDATLDQVFLADVSYDDDKRIVKLTHEESGRAVVISNSIE